MLNYIQIVTRVNTELLAEIMKHSYPSATGKLLCVLLKPGVGELLTYVASGQGEHWKQNNIFVTVESKYPQKLMSVVALLIPDLPHCLYLRLYYYYLLDFRLLYMLSTSIVLHCLYFIILSYTL